jgi:nucleoside-diphosphate-sugar epimerase
MNMSGNGGDVMKKVLILGGTRFFGKHLVERLIEQGIDVTVATRGKTTDPFGERVKRMVIDRYDLTSLQQAADAGPWDVIYDQICYASKDAQDACEAFRGKAGRYVFTSSLSVYGYDEEPQQEEKVDPYTYPIQMGSRFDFSYNEGKRQAEAVFFQKADFPVLAVRFPVVMGEDDYTERLLFHINHIKEGRPIGAPNPEARLCFVSAEEAARFLQWSGENEVEGPINACSCGTITLRELIALIEEATGKQAVLTPQAEESDMSPYSVEHSWYMDNGKAQKAGFLFDDLHNWLPELIRNLS